jgi:hypothetical protein
MSTASDIVNQIKLSTDFQTNKKQLREKILTDMHLPYNNGLFKITPELLAFVSTWPMDTLYLEDVYQNPIEVDKQAFLTKAQEHYHSIMNSWHQQYEELRKIRKV